METCIVDWIYFPTKPKIIHLSQVYACYDFLKLWITETFRSECIEESYTEIITR